jgi:hypothetical protein
MSRTICTKPALNCVVLQGEYIQNLLKICLNLQMPWFPELLNLAPRTLDMATATLTEALKTPQHDSLSPELGCKSLILCRALNLLEL